VLLPSGVWDLTALFEGEELVFAREIVAGVFERMRLKIIWDPHGQREGAGWIPALEQPQAAAGRMRWTTDARGQRTVSAGSPGLPGGACATDTIEVETLGPGYWRYTCSNQRRHPGSAAWTWEGTATSRSDEEAAAGGKTEELGLYDDLPSCLVPGEPFHRVRGRRVSIQPTPPEVYEQLLSDYGHTRLARTGSSLPRRSSRRRSAN